MTFWHMNKYEKSSLQSKTSSSKYHFSSNKPISCHLWAKIKSRVEKCNFLKPFSTFRSPFCLKRRRSRDQDRKKITQVQSEQGQSSVGTSYAAIWRRQSRQKLINGPLHIQLSFPLRKQVQELACLKKRCKSRRMSHLCSGMTQISSKNKLLRSKINL